MRTNLIKISIASAIVGLLALASCTSGSTSATSANVTPSSTAVSGSGVVVFRDLDGGFYGILTDSGSLQYVAVNLPSNMQTDGLHVRFSGNVAGAEATAHNWGTAVRLESVDLIR